MVDSHLFFFGYFRFRGWGTEGLISYHFVSLLRESKQSMKYGEAKPKTILPYPGLSI
jgi:hypothetical protein